MSYKENDQHLGKGSGINLSSAKNSSHGFGGSSHGHTGGPSETPDADGPGTSHS